MGTAIFLVLRMYFAAGECDMGAALLVTGKLICNRIYSVSGQSIYMYIPLAISVGPAEVKRAYFIVNIIR